MSDVGEPGGNARPRLVVSDDPPGAAGRRKREPQPRQRVPIGATETIRNRLGLGNENFSEALGFHPSTYGGYVQKGFITKTGALAAEALMRRQQASGEAADDIFLLRIIKGTPTAYRITGLRKMVLDGTEYFLIPTDQTRT